MTRRKQPLQFAKKPDELRLDECIFAEWRGVNNVSPEDCLRITLSRFERYLHHYTYQVTRSRQKTVTLCIFSESERAESTWACLVLVPRAFKFELRLQPHPYLPKAARNIFKYFSNITTTMITIIVETREKQKTALQMLIVDHRLSQSRLTRAKA